LNWTRLILTVVALVQLAGAGVMDRRLVYDSLRDVEPWQRRQWLAERGLQDYYKARSWRPTADSGLRCVGRWSYGPSVKISLRATTDDTIVCLARGSGASLIRLRSRDSLTLGLLSDINCNGIVSRAIIKDTLVYCGMNQGGTGIEVWGVSDLTNPHRLSYVYLPPIMDVAVQGTFLYATGYVQDSLRIFNVADPRNPVQVGACSDSGFPMCVSGDYCYLADRGGVNIIDVSNPAAPYRTGKTGGGGIALSVAVRDSLCFFGVDNSTLQIYNVRNPASPYFLGSLSGTQPADLYLPETNDTVLYTSTFEIVSIADPSSPRRIGLVYPPGWEYGVAAVPALNYALVADCFDGMVTINITNPTAPSIDTFLFNAGLSEDVCLDQGRAYVAQHQAGLRILDVTNPASPYLLGQADTLGTRPSTHTAVARDSFAFVGWTGVPYFRSFDVSDPHHPALAGGLDIVNPAEDMVLRDSFAYVAELGCLQVVNVARPREPELVGICNTQDGTDFGLAVQDTLAFLISGMIEVINVAQPANPTIVSRAASFGSGIAVRDTFVYVPYGYDTLRVFSAANPKQLRLLGYAPLQSHASDVALAESVALVSTVSGLEAFSLEDPAHPRWRAAISTPYGPRRVVYSAPYFYTVMSEAGVAIYSAESLGVEEQQTYLRAKTGLRPQPNPVRSTFLLVSGMAEARVAELRDATGRVVSAAVVCRRTNQGLSLNVSKLAPGVYFVEVESDRGASSVKFVKQ